MNILFDGNFAFHKTFSVFSTYYKGQDLGEVLRDEGKKQVFIRKLVIELCHTIRSFDDVEKVVVVFDTHSWRYNFYPDYKYALTRVRDEYYKEFIRVLDEFEAFLRKKGIIVSRVEGAEGDDLMYIWSVYFGVVSNEELLIITGDSDIRQIMTPNVALFNNNSKNLKLYCVPEAAAVWQYRVPEGAELVPVRPFDVLLYKVLLGDKSDNIPSVKRGFGEKALEKFIATLPADPALMPSVETQMFPMADWIATRFSDFAHIPYEEALEKINFNLKMTWLGLSVYNDLDYVNANHQSLLEAMLTDVERQKDTYKYNKEWTLESFYGMPIK